MARQIYKGEKDYSKLEAVAKMLEATSKNGYRYEVEGCWQDFGAGIGWTTIVCYNDNETGVLHSWQILSPKEWEHVITAETITDLCVIAEHITKGKYFQDK